MALVDTLEILPSNLYASTWQSLYVKFNLLIEAALKVADPDSGLWWQVMDQPTREGNYLESSVSAMLTYALLKGNRLQYISDSGNGTDGVVAAAKKAYQSLTDRFVDQFANGTLGWNGTVAVCSLNSTANYTVRCPQPLAHWSSLTDNDEVLCPSTHSIQ